MEASASRTHPPLPKPFVCEILVIEERPGFSGKKSHSCLNLPASGLLFFAVCFERNLMVQTLPTARPFLISQIRNLK